MARAIELDAQRHKVGVRFHSKLDHLPAVLLEASPGSRIHGSPAGMEEDLIEIKGVRTSSAARRWAHE